VPISEPDTERVAREFCACTLPHEEWTHEAHLRVGLWHLLRYPPSESLTRLRDGIRAYNEATGVANTDTSGYHESITRVFVVLIADFLGKRDATTLIDDLAEALVKALGDKHVLFEYYTEEVLMSVEARAGWVAPDRAPLPVLDGLS